jgi:hypothetical protein
MHVFKSGNPQGSNGSTPSGGQIQPKSTDGAKVA